MPFSPQAYQKGATPKSRILPAGGKVLTSEDEYNLLSDRFFPDPIGESLSILSRGKIPTLALFRWRSGSQWGKGFHSVGIFGRVWRQFWLLHLGRLVL